MNFESIIIILLVFAILVWIFINFFLNNSLTKERLRILLEKQEGLEKSLSDILEKNFDKIDLKVEKNSNENISNLQKIREKISLIDRAQQNISGLTQNVVDLKNILSNTTQEEDLVK